MIDRPILCFKDTEKRRYVVHSMNYEIARQELPDPKDKKKKLSTQFEKAICTKLDFELLAMTNPDDKEYFFFQNWLKDGTPQDCWFEVKLIRNGQESEYKLIFDKVRCVEITESVAQPDKDTYNLPRIKISLTGEPGKGIFRFCKKENMPFEKDDKENSKKSAVEPKIVNKLVEDGFDIIRKESAKGEKEGDDDA
jgi:hypothetical protein